MRLSTRYIVVSSTISICLAAVIAFQLAGQATATRPVQRVVGAAVVGRAADASGVDVGPLLVPCPLQSTSSSVPAPAGVAIARISSPPPSLSDSVKAAFPSTPPFPACENPSRVATAFKDLDPSTIIAFRILGQVEYSGAEATVTVVTATPSPTALSDGLNLGDPAGSLSDGTALWSQTGNYNDIPENSLYWFTAGEIVQMESPDLSVDQLKALASGVAIS